MPDPSFYPALNATLNGTCAVLLVTGRRFIAQKRITAHRNTMIAAFITSAMFLTSYLYYHFGVRLTMPFQGHGWIRPVYFTLLLTHTILAAVVVPMILVTLSRGLRARYDKHRQIARWTYPVWLYVSVTGVIIYFMLYHWFRG
jgi:putative membrane protein